jgi:uncharacterized membrane protein
MREEEQIESYLNTLRVSLGPIAIGDREEIVREIAAHVRDSSEQSGASIETVLKRLGPAEKLAREYRDGLLIRRASRSFSPVLLLRGALRLATRGISGVFVLFTAMFGYLIGGGLLIVAFAKCFAPGHTGVWVENGRLVSAGAIEYGLSPHAHEVLGYWIIPLALTLGSLLFIATTWIIRSSLRLSQRVQARL